MTDTKIPTTPKEFAQLWYDALKSGNYQQGIARLRSADDTYCCLGVFSEELRKLGILTARPESGLDAWTYLDPENQDDASRVHLPNRAARLLLFDGTLEIPEHLRKAPTLRMFGEGYAVNLNDVHHFTFDEIAECVALTYNLET